VSGGYQPWHVWTVVGVVIAATAVVVTTIGIVATLVWGRAGDVMNIQMAFRGDLEKIERQLDGLKTGNDKVLAAIAVNSEKLNTTIAELRYVDAITLTMSSESRPSLDAAVAVFMEKGDKMPWGLFNTVRTIRFPNGMAVYIENEALRTGFDDSPYKKVPGHPGIYYISRPKIPDSRSTN
jgi:hypothetical protein